MAGVITKVGVAASVLHGIGAPVNSKTLGAMVGWFNAEGGNWNNSAAYNPLNTTLSTPGAKSINGVGVKAYSNWNQGINATIQTLKQGNMNGIVQAFKSGDPQQVIHAIGSSPWGTNGNIVASTISAAVGQHFAPPAAGGMARQMALPSSGIGTTINVPSITNTNWGSAIADAMLQDSTSAPSSTGKIKSDNVLGDAINLVNQGGYTTTTLGKTVKINGPGGMASLAASKVASGAGDVNPLQHFTLGRTDMGVDANAKPGTPILAPNDVKILGIEPGWYAGQPYVGFQYLSGPNKGKVGYVAEQITALPHAGQIIRRGDPIARYAQSGTGIEIGWANPSNWRQTLAQATGQTGTGDHSNAPAGVQFRNYLNSTAR